MKNGKISREGEPDEIAREDPSLMRDWQQAIRQMSESETEMSESEALLEERRSLKRQISFLSSASTKEVSSTHDDKGMTILKTNVRSFDAYLYQWAHIN